jgi:hypothetical protein
MTIFDTRVENAEAGLPTFDRRADDRLAVDM